MSYNNNIKDLYDSKVDQKEFDLNSEFDHEIDKKYTQFNNQDDTTSLNAHDFAMRLKNKPNKQAMDTGGSSLKGDETLNLQKRDKTVELTKQDEKVTTEKQAQEVQARKQDEKVSTDKKMQKEQFRKQNEKVTAQKQDDKRIDQQNEQKIAESSKELKEDEKDAAGKKSDIVSFDLFYSSSKKTNDDDRLQKLKVTRSELSTEKNDLSKSILNQQFKSNRTSSQQIKNENELIDSRAGVIAKESDVTDEISTIRKGTE